MPDDKAFVYQPLPPRSIRLLNVSGNADNLVYTISNANLDDLPSYVTLSYTWDGQQRDQDLLCNGSNLKVTRNVLTVLPYLFRHNGPHDIWIDGVCINQEDPLEKNVQVPMMHEIYAKTSKTIVWLGESSASIAEAMEIIPVIPFIISSVNDHLYSDPLERLPPVWAGISDLLYRPWFTRLWAFQEAVLPDIVEIMCGDNVLPCEVMISLVQAITKPSLMGLVRKNVSEVVPGMRTLKLIETYKRWRVGDRFSFSALVGMGEDFSCHDSRDKIYGLLGLAEESFRAQIVVDYQKKTATELYLEVSRFEVSNEPILVILHLSCNRVKNIDLPSWCPNYGEPPLSTPLIGLAEDYHAGTKDMIRGRVIPERTAPFRAIISPDSNVLNARGFRFSRVESVIPAGWIRSHHTEVNMAQNAAQSLAWDEKCFKLSQQTYSQEDEALDVYSRIIIGNSVNNRKCTVDQREIYDLMKRMLRVASQKEPIGHAKDWGGSWTAGIWDDLLEYMNKVSAACSKRAFFRARDGSLGLGPPDLQVGDVVCIICNTYTPFIVRPRPGDSGHNELVGEAYVHGLMYGEIFNIVDEDKWETISLD